MHVVRKLLRLAGLFVLPYQDKMGRSHWITQRITAVALLPLYAWLLFVAFPDASAADHAELFVWMQDPMNATFICLTIVFSLHHMVLGLEVIVEDYIATPALNKLTLLCIRWGTFLFQLGVLAAVVRIMRQS